MKHILSVSMPRSGHHLLVRLLRSYYGEQFSYCTTYGKSRRDCCKKIPCIEVDKSLDNSHIFMQKNHDFKLKSPLLQDYKYIIQYRHPIPRAMSNFELFIKNGDDIKKRNTKLKFYNFLNNEADYYIGFYQKYIESKFPNILLLKYEDLVDRPEESFRKVITFIQDDDEFFTNKWVKASQELERRSSGGEHKKRKKIFKRNIFDFRFFDYEIIKEIEDKIFSKCPNLGYDSCLNESNKSLSAMINNQDFIQLTSQLNDEDFIDVAYLLYMRRKPDSQGKKNYCEKLRKSVLNRQQLIESLKSSEEFKRKSSKPSPEAKQPLLSS